MLWSVWYPKAPFQPQSSVFGDASILLQAWMYSLGNRRNHRVTAWPRERWCQTENVDKHGIFLGFEIKVVQGVCASAYSLLLKQKRDESAAYVGIEHYSMWVRPSFSARVALPLLESMVRAFSCRPSSTLRPHLPLTMAFSTPLMSAP